MTQMTDGKFVWFKALGQWGWVYWDMPDEERIGIQLAEFGQGWLSLSELRPDRFIWVHREDFNAAEKIVRYGSCNILPGNFVGAAAWHSTFGNGDRLDLFYFRSMEPNWREKYGYVLIDGTNYRKADTFEYTEVSESALGAWHRHTIPDLSSMEVIALRLALLSFVNGDTSTELAGMKLSPLALQRARERAAGMFNRLDADMRDTDAFLFRCKRAPKGGA